ncbi:MAG: MFS transporter [Thermoguttaceae bacterium]|nr:MFS transporter [Thermoguttaceae bacterium]MDW8039654.1 MFS transporter [Thermoguttaceae bacterium]
MKKPRSFEGPSSLEGHPIHLVAKGQSLGYSRAFWLAYASNFLISVAVSVLYRYADFVRLLGGTEYQLGWIVGVGMIGSLSARLALGSGIDRRGPKLVWLLSLIGFCLICFAHLGLSRPDTPAIYLLRIAYCLAVAGIFGATMAFVSSRMPVEQMAEMIGMLGTAGFMGMVVGAQVGDWLCGAAELTRADVDRLFVAAGLIGLSAIIFAVLATGQARPRAIRHRQPPIGYLLWRYQPGPILLVALIAGAALGWPSTFLATYAADLSIPRIGTFFTLYSLTAVLTRVLTRRWPQQFGLPSLVLAGLAILAASQFFFLLVQNEGTLILPGLTYGIGHAILFPSLVAAGCRTFPNRHRGLGTMLIMSAFDLGTMVGSPLLGAIIHHAPTLGLPSYPTLFVLMGVVLAGTALFYCLVVASGHQDTPNHGKVSRAQKPNPMPLAGSSLGQTSGARTLQLAHLHPSHNPEISSKISPLETQAQRNDLAKPHPPAQTSGKLSTKHPLPQAG